MPRTFLLGLSLAVTLVSATSAVFQVGAVLHAGRILSGAAQRDQQAAQSHTALRYLRVATTRWLSEGGSPEAEAELARRREEAARALGASAISARTGVFLAQLDAALAEVKPALTRGDDRFALQREVERPILAEALALDRAASQAGEAERAQLLARRRRKGFWLGLSAAAALFGLLAAALLARQQLRAAAKREGARAMREELLERISDGYFALDRDFRFVHVNTAGEKTLDVSRAEVLGRTIWEVWPGLSEHGLGAYYRAAMEGAPSPPYEVLSPRKQRWYQARGFRSADGLSVFIEDITEARAMREALAESEARHRQIVQTAQEGIWVLDRGGKTTFVNEKLCELLGYPREELLGKHLFDFMDAEGQRIAAENLQRRGLGLREKSDFKLLRKDGSTLWGLLATSPLTVGGEGDASTLAMLTDLTERRRAEAEREVLFSRERALRTAAEATHDRYRVLANLVPHIVWTHRADGSVDFVNQSYADQTGQPPEQALGSGWQAMIHPEDLEGYVEVWKGSLLSGEPFQREVRMRRADGSWRWHLNMAHAARDAEGRLLRWFGVALEIEGRGEA